MIRIVIPSTPVELIKYTDKAGRPAELRKQTGYAFTVTEAGEVAQFPDKFGFILGRDQQPYAPGEYTLHPSAAVVDRDGRLSCVPRLTPAAKR